MYEYNAKILRIVDGDTIDVDIDLGFGVWIHKERVRLEGIDTPESRTKDLEEKKFGLLSKEYVRGLLPVGSIVKLVCKSYDSKGKFGRILGDIQLKETRMIGREIVEHSSLVKTMIDNGYGVEYSGQSKELIQEAHLKNRERLIKEGVIDG
jgi:micrococcal nuclease